MNLFLTIQKIRISLFFIIIYNNITTSIKRENIYIISLSKINIEINSSGAQNIFSSSFNNYPDSILINNNPIEYDNSKTLDLVESSNNIELTWNNDLTTCEKMFSNCNKITKIDLS